MEEDKPITMSYTVEIDPSARAGVDHPTNLYAKVDYKNVEGQIAAKYFPIPEVQVPASGKITINKKVTGGDTNKEFIIYVDGPDDHTWTMLLKDGEEKTIEGLGAGTYTIREVVPMNYKLVSIEPSEVTFSLESLDEENFVTITNKKTNDGWFWDEDTKNNILRVGNW